MKLQTLKYFVTLSESRSISEAAQKLYVSQPSLSKSLQLLEEEIGFPLFVRTETGISLTDEGRKILPEAKQILEYCQGWKQLGRHSLQKLDVYIHYSFPDFLLPKAILQTRKKHPDLDISYSVCMEPEKYISRSVQEPVLVLSLCRGAEGVERYAQIQGNPPLELMEGSYHCLASVHSPLAQLAHVNAEILKNYYLVLPSNVIPSENFNFAVGFVASIPRQRIIFVESATNVVDLVRQDPECYALSYYPALKRYAGVEQGELKAIPLQDRPMSERMILSFSRQAYDEHPAVRELVQGVENQAKQFLLEHREADAAQRE